MHLRVHAQVSSPGIKREANTPCAFYLTVAAPSCTMFLFLFGLDTWQARACEDKVEPLVYAPLLGPCFGDAAEEAHLHARTDIELVPFSFTS
eukprot:m.65218 g.65218  ORF g.65218 m.65218 type:complete len:92 (-) comp13532_c2_seq3:185-460(-)